MAWASKSAKGHIGYIKVEGLEELQAQIQKVGNPPKKVITKSAKAGMKDPLKEAKRLMPVSKITKTRGSLKKGLKQVMEKGANRRTKTVYRMVWDKKLVDIYLKKSSGAYGGKPPKAYYPHSVEYGFLTKYGYKEGRHIIRDTVEKHEESSIKKVMDVLQDYIDDMTR
jgi:hypothetical protein